MKCNFTQGMVRPVEPCAVPRALIRPMGPCSVPRNPDSVWLVLVGPASLEPSRKALLGPAGP